MHVKGAHLHGSPFFSIKEAAGFYGNARKGLPVGSGLVLVFDATTGLLRMILLDNGYLTELRTGAAGALAADLLARRDVETIGIIGSGGQARYQLEALLGVRRPRRVLVYGRSAPSVAAYAREMSARLGLAVSPVASARDAVIDSDVIITTTPSRSRSCARTGCARGRTSPRSVPTARTSASWRRGPGQGGPDRGRSSSTSACAWARFITR